jgi:hypothetical protein
MPAATKSLDSITTAELSKLYVDTGIDLSAIPPIMTPVELAPVLGVTVGSLANERYRHVGIPFIRHGSRIRYLRADVARYLIAHRISVVDAQ